MVPFESLGTFFYLPSIVTMAVSLAISEIFSIKEWPDLEMWVWGRSRSFRVAQFHRPCMTFYWSAIVTIVMSCTSMSRCTDISARPVSLSCPVALRKYVFKRLKSNINLHRR